MHNHLFKPVKMPGVGDWLHSHKERGQSVRSLNQEIYQSVAACNLRYDQHCTLRKIHQRRIATVGKAKELMEIWFGCKCRLAKPVSIEDVAVDGLVDGEQLLVRNAADYLKRLRPGRRIFANIMVTMVDLTPGEGELCLWPSKPFRGLGRFFICAL